jgi:serine/threonine-protein kinase
MPPRAYTYPRLSPDEKRVLVSTQGDRNVWIYDLASGTPTMLTEEGRSQAAIWTPDGTRVTFGSSTTGNENLFLLPAEGAAIPRPLTKSPLLHRASSWSPNGQVLAFVAAQINPTSYDILTLSGEDQQAVPLLSSRFNESHPEFSPDGHWLAYASDESGRSEIHVRPYPGPGPTMVISTDGGTAPVWARNGQQLFYLAPAQPAGKAALRMMAVAVELGTEISTGRPRALFETNLSPGASIRNYDVARDGRFLIVQYHERPPIRPAQIVLVQNWLEELKRRVPGGS